MDSFMASLCGVFWFAQSLKQKETKKDNRRIKPWLRKADVEVWESAWEVGGTMRMIQTVTEPTKL
jgi:UDP-N-acetyl-D-mannosaminuronate dehydrogenase